MSDNIQERIIIAQAFNKAIDTLLVMKPQVFDRGDASISLTRVERFMNDVRVLTIMYAQELKDLETCPIDDLKSLLANTNDK